MTGCQSVRTNSMEANDWLNNEEKVAGSFFLLIANVRVKFLQ